MNWGGSGIEQIVFGFILGSTKLGSNVIELGSGFTSTYALRSFYKLYSVDHNKEYQNKVDDVKYIYAPIVNDWYNVDILKKKLPQKSSLVLIDGCNRLGILEHLDLFDKNTKYLIHDTYREKEIELGRKLSKILNRKPIWYSFEDYWCYI